MAAALRLLGLAALAGSGAGKELTSKNWAKQTAGKALFVKFFAPWCAHCRELEPAWTKLMKKYRNHNDTLVAEVDCEGAGKSLCDLHDVLGYPFLKWGHPNGLVAYEGVLEYEDLKLFTEENVRPQCSPQDIALCDEKDRKRVKELMALPAPGLKAALLAMEGDLADAETQFESEVQRLQDAYEALEMQKRMKMEAVKADGIGLMKAVKNMKMNSGISAGTAEQTHYEL